MIVIAILYLYFGNIRIRSNTGKMIIILEELIDANTRYNQIILEIEKKVLLKQRLD